MKLAGRRIYFWQVFSIAIFLIASVAGLYVLKLQNQITYFDDLSEAFSSPTQVETLILRNQNISKLPEDISLFSQLAVLNLGNNQIESLPGTIGNLRALKKLDLSNNNLSTLPSDFGKLSNLQVLDLSGNNFAEVPRVLFAMDSLQTLIMSRNKVTRVSLETIMRLNSADFSDNAIEHIDNEDVLLARLVKIDLQNNRIISVPENLFAAPLLNELILGGNPLDKLSIIRYEAFNRKIKQ